MKKIIFTLISITLIYAPFTYSQDPSEQNQNNIPNTNSYWQGASSYFSNWINFPEVDIDESESESETLEDLQGDRLRTRSRSHPNLLSRTDDVSNTASTKKQRQKSANTRLLSPFERITSWFELKLNNAKEKLADKITNKTIKAIFDEIEARYLKPASKYVKPTAFGFGGFLTLLIAYKIGLYRGKNENLPKTCTNPNPYISPYE